MQPTESSGFDARGAFAGSVHIPWTTLHAVGVRTGGPAGSVRLLGLTEEGLLESSAIVPQRLDELAAHLPGLDTAKVAAAKRCQHEHVYRLWHRHDPLGLPSREELAARFAALVNRLGATADSRAIFTSLFAAWSDAARHYHDLEHLADCLREVDAQPASPARDQVELALFYHDAIYDVHARDSEARSAAWLERDATTLGLPAEETRNVVELVMATAHGGAAIRHAEADLVHDIDLSILGRDRLRFLEFEYGVAQEYASIPTLLFRIGRGRLLQRMLDRPLFRTADFRDRYETTARANLHALLGSPRYRAYRWLRWLPI